MKTARRVIISSGCNFSTLRLKILRAQSEHLPGDEVFPTLVKPPMAIDQWAGQVIWVFLSSNRLHASLLYVVEDMTRWRIEVVRDFLVIVNGPASTGSFLRLLLTWGILSASLNGLPQPLKTDEEDVV